MDIARFVSAVSATEPDWSREHVRYFWDPGRKLIRSIRKYQSARTSGTVYGRLMSRYWKLVHSFWSVMTQCEIHLNCRIEGGLIMPHPTGIIVHPDAKIGPNCLIFQQVTIAGAVELGGHCDLGSGAKIMGPLRIGRHVQVGANAVVTRDVADCTVVAGVPAREIATLATGAST